MKKTDMAVWESFRVRKVSIWSRIIKKVCYNDNECISYSKNTIANIAWQLVMVDIRFSHEVSLGRIWGAGYMKHSILRWNYEEQYEVYTR